MLQKCKIKCTWEFGGEQYQRESMVSQSWAVSLVVVMIPGDYHQLFVVYSIALSVLEKACHGSRVLA